MSKQLSQHAEWLSLIEVSGPFLAEPILKDAFPQGLEKIDPFKKKRFRQTYDEWRETIDSHDDQDVTIREKIHQEWINWVIKFGLEWDEDEDGYILKQGDAIPEEIKLTLAEHNLTLKPDYVVYANDNDKPYLLLSSYPPNISLEEVVKGDAWSTTPAERMAQLCRAMGTRLGMITNGEQWLFVDAPEGGITTYASWYARLWSQEPVTLQAFYSLLNIGIIYNGFEGSRKLTELLDESLKHQDEVTETLGEQVTRAVEVLIQSLDRINHDHNGKLLEGVEPTELYEAGLTLMMRLVFLLCAEERGLLLLGDETYEANYALSTLRLKLREEAGLHGDEVLSFRKNAWARLLAIFRAVYAGVKHEDMRMPALGGSLFDPDRFAFLEGRAKGSSWKIEEAKPLPIDNRTVLLFLDAIQLYQGRTISYRALDVEQIGYVYEGLLEKTVIRAPDVTLELNGSKSAKNPLVELKELASAELEGDATVKNLLKDRTKSSVGRIDTDLDKELSDAQLDKLLIACSNDAELRDRIKPYYHFLRVDAWENPLLYPKDAFMVTTGTDRRETGTHYTPKSLTESIVKETLEPIVYIGPTEGKPREDWQLKTAAELLDLKICDLAMGSGAFLVQVCRWLAERICETWQQAEQDGKFVSSEGEVLTEQSEELLPVDAEERLFVAKRLIAERCLYGVDVNPLAVELAKLSIWLVTLSKGRPFGFLDHNLKHGDSMLGITDLNQLNYLDMQYGKGSSKHLFAQQIEQRLKEAIDLRMELRNRPIRDINDVEVMAHLDQQAREKLELPGLVADALVGETLKAGGKNTNTTLLSIETGKAFEGYKENIDTIKKRANKDLNIDLPTGKRERRPFHWCLMFPEVFSKKGFNAVIGNPPFLGGRRIKKYHGKAYLDMLTNSLCPGGSGNADLCSFFFRLADMVVCVDGLVGMLATNTISQGDTRSLGLDEIVQHSKIIFVIDSFDWPGSANLTASLVIYFKGDWRGELTLNHKRVSTISSSLSESKTINWKPQSLLSNKNISFQGSIVLGKGFVLSMEEADNLITRNKKNIDVVFPYLRGEDFTSSPSHIPERYVINFFDWPLERQEDGKVNTGLVAEDYPEALKIIEEKVKPERQRVDESGNYVLRNPLPKKWWIYSDKRPALYRTIKKFERVLFHSFTSKYVAFSFVPNGYVYAGPHNVFALDAYSDFALLQSSIHQAWAWSVGSTMRNDLRYSNKVIFETFPRPLTLDDISVIGEKYFINRQNYMRENNLGLTDCYNIFHDKNFDDIAQLRELQVEMDLSVVNLYGMSDIKLSHDFHRVSYLPDSKNTRFTISEAAREEVLYRLMILNKERYEAEFKKANKFNLKSKKNPASEKQNVQIDAEAHPDLFGDDV